MMSSELAVRLATVTPMASRPLQNGQHESNASSITEHVVHDDDHAQLRPSSRPGANRSLTSRAWHALLSPFSSTALARLPRVKRPERYLRADDIPVTETNEAGERPTIRDYHSINSLPSNVHVPKKIPTSIKVEGKVWFANERSQYVDMTWLFFFFYWNGVAWVSWLNISVLLATLSLGLFNASKDDVARNFAYVYALISICTVVSHLFFLANHHPTNSLI